jgi:hypothetical protein
MFSVATVDRAFGAPIERDGSVLIPVARVASGGGEGDDGTGRGFGLWVTGSGAFVIRNGEVTWQPALDVTGRSRRAGRRDHRAVRAVVRPAGPRQGEANDATRTTADAQDGQSEDGRSSDDRPSQLRAQTSR